MAGKQLYICIVTSDFPALTETFITNKVLELKRRGHRITVIKNNNGGINTSHLKHVKDAGIEILRMPSIISIKDLFLSPAIVLRSLSTSKKVFKSKFKFFLQLSLLQKHQYDILHFEFSGLAIAYQDVIKKLSLKTIVSCRGTAEKVKPLSEPTRIQNLKKIFSITDKIHCVSEDMASTIKVYNAPKEKIFVNPPSIDTEIFKRNSDYDDKLSSIKILSVGRLTFQKGYLIGLLAIKNLKNKCENFLWTIAGDGPQMEELLFHIEELGLSNNIILSGKKNRDEILNLYNTADIFFLPSVYEGIANVCLEAMSMELPVVSSDCSGMSEVIQNNVNGLLARNYNHEEMADHLLTLCNNYTLRKQLGSKARNTIVSKFTIAKQVDVFEKHYLELVGEAS